MPLADTRRLTGPTRTAAANRHVGWLLAFVAGATNAGAFIAVRRYASHMTAVVSALADEVVLGDFKLAAGALAALLAFAAGAATLALLTNVARRHHLSSHFALPLLLEAVLLLAFFLGGVAGAIGFQRMGDAATLPLAALLVALAVVPVLDDMPAYLAGTRRA